jgi:flagellar biosynthesis/type III secretory pathway protein FliH
MSVGPFLPCLRCSPHFTRAEEDFSAREHALMQNFQRIAADAIERAKAEARAEGKREGLEEAAQLVESTAKSCWRGGQTERSDCLTELLLEIRALKDTNG